MPAAAPDPHVLMPPADFTVQSSRDDHTGRCIHQMKTYLLFGWAVCVLLLSLLSGCNYPSSAQQTPTSSVPFTTQTIAAVLTRAPTEPQPALQHTPTSSPPATEIRLTEVATPGGCINGAAFVADTSYPDNTRVAPGKSFLKTWTLRNSGTCTWTPAYALVFYGGARLSAPNAIPLTGSVEPDETVNLAVDLVAPTKPGTYQGFWRLRDNEGDLFGIGPGSDQSFWVKIIVPATPTVSVSPSPSASPTSTPTQSTTELPSATPTASPTGDATPSATSTPTSTATPSPSPSASPTS